MTQGNTPAERLHESKGFVTIGVLKPLPSDPARDDARMYLTLG